MVSAEPPTPPQVSERSPIQEATAQYRYLQTDYLPRHITNDRILGIPGCFGSDIMHLASFNLADLLVSLWRGQLSDNETTDSVATWPCVVLRGDTWEQHGKAVAEATPYFPGSFDRPPLNIAEKINSGYKA